VPTEGPQNSSEIETTSAESSKNPKCSWQTKKNQYLIKTVQNRRPSSNGIIKRIGLRKSPMASVAYPPKTTVQQPITYNNRGKSQSWTMWATQEGCLSTEKCLTVLSNGTSITRVTSMVVTSLSSSNMQVDNFKARLVSINRPPTIQSTRSMT